MDSARIKRHSDCFICSLMIASSDLLFPQRRRKVVAFIKVCIVLIFAHASSRCLFVCGPPKGFSIFAIKGDTLFYWYGCGFFREAVGGIHGISAHEDNQNKRFRSLVAFKWCASCIVCTNTKSEFCKNGNVHWFCKNGHHRTVQYQYLVQGEAWWVNEGMELQKYSDTQWVESWF